MTVMSTSMGTVPQHPAQPPTRRLIAAAIVGGIGVIILSIAFGAFVATTRLTVSPAALGDARALTASIPAIVAIGLLHLVAAAGILRRRDVVRIAAAVVTGLSAIAAGTAAAMLFAGVDPLGPSSASHPTGGGIGILLVAAMLYGLAALAAGSGPAED